MKCSPEGSDKPYEPEHDFELHKEEDALIWDLTDTVDSLRDYIKSTGRDKSPEWLSLNFKIQELKQRSTNARSRYVLGKMGYRFTKFY